MPDDNLNSLLLNHDVVHIYSIDMIITSLLYRFSFETLYAKLKDLYQTLMMT